MKVSAVIPAYNEEKRISLVLKAVVNSEVNEVIVVDDGSSDNTAKEAKKFRLVQVVQLDENKGKAAALAAGVKKAEQDVLLFMDADLVNLKPSHVNKMIEAFQKDEKEMIVGVFTKGKLSTDLSQKINPRLSGQRILYRNLWEELNLSKTKKFRVETHLSSLYPDYGKVKLEGVSHVKKENKRGFLEGFKARLVMYKDMILAHLETALDLLKRHL